LLSLIVSFAFFFANSVSTSVNVDDVVTQQSVCVSVDAHDVVAQQSFDTSLDVG